jgi:hypothetical protein
MQDELLAAIEAGDEQTCVGLLKGQNETTRRALHPAVKRTIDATDSTIRSDFGPSRSENLRRHRAAQLAMLGTATLGELKKSAAWQFPDDAAYAILTQRRPDWLADWAQFEIDRNVWNWAVVRAMVRNELIPKPTSDSYILGMIVAPGRYRPPRQLLDADRGLLEDELWRLFECEGSGELSLAAYDKYVQEQNTWLEGFRSMAADGIIDRPRVLTATLDALARDFAPFRAGWFSRLHEALKPTRAERVAYRERYLHLLSSRVPATVSFAMKAIVEVDKAGALDALSVLNQLGAALDARDKGTAERALRILNKAAQNAGSANVKARIAAVAARGLGHQSIDVQASALSLTEVNTALEDFYRPALAPSVRAGLKTKVVQEEAAVSPLPPVREVQRVVPVGNLGELAELFAAVLENQGPPVDIERVMEGVARMSASERVTETLARRAAKMLESRERQQPRCALAELALAWTRGRQVPQPAAENNLADFLIWRLWCVAEQTVQRQERPLMSLPTWPDGRIDPMEFARRVAVQPRHELQARHADRASLFYLDLLQARLRAGVDEERAPPEPHLTWKTKSWQASGRSYSHHYAVLEVPGSPKPNRFDPALLSTVSFGASLEMKRWCATVCPAWREGWFAAGCRDLAYNLEWWQADWSTRAYLESLVQLQTEIGPMGGLLLALGLGAKERGQSMLAVDALIALVCEGRLAAAALGRALVEAASSGAIKFARWSKQLFQAAQAGPLQTKAIFLALEILFESGQGTEAADYFKLVELERELAHQTGLRLSRPGAISILRRIPTGGKTKRVITELLSL